MASAAVPELRKRVRADEDQWASEDDSQATQGSMTTLFQLGEPGRRAVLELLERGTPDERRSAVQTLNNVPEVPPSALSGLVRRYQDAREFATVRASAAAALVRVRPMSTEALRWVETALKNPDEEVASGVVSLLEGAGCPAVPALPTLRRELARLQKARSAGPGQDGPRAEASDRELRVSNAVDTLGELHCPSP